VKIVKTGMFWIQKTFNLIITIGIMLFLKLKLKVANHISTCLNPTHIEYKPEAGLLNKSSCLATTLGVTKFTIVTDMIWVTLCCAT